MPKHVGALKDCAILLVMCAFFGFINEYFEQHLRNKYFQNTNFLSKVQCSISASEAFLCGDSRRTDWQAVNKMCAQMRGGMHPG